MLIAKGGMNSFLIQPFLAKPRDLSFLYPVSPSLMLLTSRLKAIEASAAVTKRSIRYVTEIDKYLV